MPNRAQVTTGTPDHHLSWDQALSWRLQRHRLTARAPATDVIQVVSTLCGLHAQVMSSAKLSLWARIDGLGDDDLAKALWTNRTLTKLWATRGTLYLLPSAELGLWLAGLATYTKFHNSGYPEIDELADAVGRALDGQIMTREELALRVEELTGSAEYGTWVRFSWGSYLKAASFRGLICFGPSEGNRIRFTSPATWVPGRLDTLDRATALAEVTRRFLAGYGPAGWEELTRWWVGPPQPRRGASMIAALGEETVEVDVEGERCRVLARDLPQLLSTAPAQVARLLPAFDPWVMGARRQPPQLPSAQLRRIFQPQGWISPVILVNGRVSGVWKHARNGRRLEVTLEPFGRLPGWARAQAEAEAQRLAAYLGGQLAVSWE